jgi:hypothetical protein
MPHGSSALRARDFIFATSVVLVHVVTFVRENAIAIAASHAISIRAGLDDLDRHLFAFLFYELPREFALHELAHTTARPSRGAHAIRDGRRMA